MKYGFLKTAAVTPDMKVADCDYNSEQIIKNISKAANAGVKLCVFPALSITGSTCGDLFFQKALLESAAENLKKIISETAQYDIINVVGLPVSVNGSLYNCAAVLYKGKLLGFVPQKNITAEKARYFSQGQKYEEICFSNDMIPMGTDIVFKCTEMTEFSFGIELCDDLYSADSNASVIAKYGANIIINLSAENEVVGRSDYTDNVIKTKSGNLICTYIYANAGTGESTTDTVFAGGSKIAENGIITSELPKFQNGITIFDTDIQKIDVQRKRLKFNVNHEYANEIYFDMSTCETKLSNKIPANPFIPSDKSETEKQCFEILQIQAHALAKRLKHTNCKSAILGLSGGLDSTLALIATVNAFNVLGLDTSGITAVTMPCFGTTDRTYNNACQLAKSYGAVLREINIKEIITKHFEDIGQDINNHDVTFENAQARERTQILMDIANQCGGMVIGTGDLSELALGWATYNGDHMSMYGVNAGIPKTLIRYVVRYVAEHSEGTLQKILLDILDTPVSPELLPPDENGTILQKTEDLVGPYELHDFFLYYIVRYGFSPKKIFMMALNAFENVYDKETILKWEKTFYRRFFTQQFKRSCSPDGPQIGSISLSPRGALNMPSDAVVNLWLNELENI